MAFFEWEERYSVGIARIDEEHKKLLFMISEFYEAVQIDREEAFAYLLDSLLDYITNHFSTEERYMDLFEYEHAEAHKKEHREFKEKILAVKKKMEKGVPVITMDTTRMLRHWVKEHVLGTDKKYSELFIKNGLC